jgi:hypothetical protein
MRAYYINLDRRPDRKEQVEIELRRVGLEPIRIAAMDGQQWNGEGWKKQGRAREAYWRGSAGCYFSHIRALEEAIIEDQFPCLIVEDDVEFRGELPHEYPYPMTLLGGNYVDGKGTYLLHAVYYATKEAAQYFCAALYKYKTTTDGVSVRLQRSDPTFCGALHEYVAFQRVDYSDIQQTIMKRTCVPDAYGCGSA